MTNLTLLKMKERIYAKPNILTWLTALLIISIALVLNVPDPSISLYVIPGLFFVGIVLTIFTDSIGRLFLNIVSYAIILILISTVFNTAMAIDPSGMLSLVWFGVLLSNIFSTITMGFIIRTTKSKHTLALITTILNIVLVMLSAYVFGTFILPENTDATQFILIAIFVILILVNIGTFLYLFISSRAYKTSLARKKVLSHNFRNPTKGVLELREKNFTEKIAKAAQENNYTFKTYTANGRKQGYLYKNNATFVLMPIDLAFTNDKKSLHKSAKVRKKTLDSIFYSIINHFSARASLPDSPVIIAFISQNHKIENIITQQVNSNERPINIHIIPIEKASEWLQDIEDEKSNNIVIFPELTEKQKTKREKADFMTQIYPKPEKTENNINTDNTDTNHNTVNHENNKNSENNEKNNANTINNVDNEKENENNEHTVDNGISVDDDSEDKK